LLNALPLNIKICRNDTKGSKSAFKEYIHANFFFCDREFTSIYKKMYTISGFHRDVHELCTLVLYAA